MSDQWREKPVHFFKCNCPCHKQILGQTYEKLRIRSDLGTSEEKLALNLRKTFTQCSIRCFVSALFNPQITRYTRRFSPQLCSANYPLQHPHIRILPPAPNAWSAKCSECWTYIIFQPEYWTQPNAESPEIAISLKLCYLYEPVSDIATVRVTALNFIKKISVSFGSILSGMLSFHPVMLRRGTGRVIIQGPSRN